MLKGLMVPMSIRPASPEVIGRSKAKNPSLFPGLQGRGVAVLSSLPCGVAIPASALMVVFRRLGGGREREEGGFLLSNCVQSLLLGCLKHVQRSSLL